MIERLRQVLLLAVAAAMVSLTGCEAIGTVFEAGMWVGVIFVVLVLAIVVFVASKFRRGRRPRV